MKRLWRFCSFYVWNRFFESKLVIVFVFFSFFVLTQTLRLGKNRLGSESQHWLELQSRHLKIPWMAGIASAV